MKKFAIITPTGDRPKPFELCKHFVLRQTIRPTEWIIVDDGKSPVTPPALSFVRYVRRKRSDTDPAHTLTVQMLEAFRHLTCDRVIIVEDDDWYHPRYLEWMLKLFEHPKKPLLIGQGNAVYYHVPLRRFYLHGNKDRASFCQTGFRSSFLPIIKHICSNPVNPFVDMRVWRENVSKNLILDGRPYCIGMKGLPGREGTTMGWKRPHLFKPDSNLVKLKSYIGEDVKLYRRFL